MSTPPVTNINQVLLQVVSSVVQAPTSGSTPNQLATIAAGSLITGNVFGRDAQGNTQLETPDGMISLKMDLFIKRGIEVVLRMEQVHKEMFARIVSVDGKSLSKYMESVGIQAPPQDSIAHSSPLLQTPSAEKPLPSTPTSSQAGSQALPSENAATLKAILLSPPFLDGEVAAKPATQALLPLPAELESLPPEIRLILARAAIGTALKIEIIKLELPTQIPAPNSPVPNATVPAPVTPAPAQPPLQAMPSTLPATPLTGQIAAANPGTPVQMLMQTIPASIPLPGNAAGPSPLPLTPVPLPASLAPQGAAASPVPMQVAPLGVAHILNQQHPVVDTLIPPPATQVVGAKPEAAAQPLLNAALTPSAQPAPAGTITSPLATSLLPDAKPISQAPSVQPVPQGSLSPTPTYKPFMPASSQQTNAPYTGAASPPSVLATANPTAAVPSPINSPITLSHSPVLTATVIASAPDGQVTLQTPIGTLNLFSPTQLPVGTQLSFTIKTIEPPLEGEAISQLSVPASGKTFKGLGDITELPYPIPYAAAGMETPKLMPRPGPALTSEILFLLSALKGGDMRKWLGEPNAKDLEKSGKGDLLQRISQDFSALRGSFGEARDIGSWLQATIPIFHQGLHSLQWFQKQGGQQDGKEKSKSSFDEHFLVDFHLTQLGHMQLDGMVKRANPGYSFDLTVRSEAGLTSAMQRDIQSIYAEAQQIGGFKGMLVFRAGLDACVKLETFYTQDTSSQPPHSILA